MKLVQHHEVVIPIFERAWEKAYLLAHSAQEWIPLVALPGQTLCAEIHTTTRAIRLCSGYILDMEQRVTYQELDATERSAY